MGLLKSTSALGRRLRKMWHGAPRREMETPLRICRFEQMEPRRMLAADIHVGAVYFEPAAGSGPDSEHVPGLVQWRRRLLARR